MRLVIVGSMFAMAMVAASKAWSGSVHDAYAAAARHDYPAALAIARPLAERGDQDARLMMGTMYALGRGVAANEAQATSWWMRAGDVAQGQYQTGVYLLQGVDDPPDEKAALVWLEKSATSGYWAAKALVAVMYQNGKGTAKNPERAYYWNGKAADDGVVGAQLSRAAESANHSRNLVDSYKWIQVLSLRCQANEAAVIQASRDGQLCPNVNRISALVASKMTLGQISTGHREALAWLQVDHPQHAAR